MRNSCCNQLSGPARNTALLDGQYLFEAAAVDRAGNRDSSPVAFSFVINADEPRVEIYSVLISNGSMAVGFGVSPANPSVSFQCRLNESGVLPLWQSCTSPWIVRRSSGLTSARFDVRALNSAGRPSVSGACGPGVTSPPTNNSLCPTFSITAAQTLVAIPARSSESVACGDANTSLVIAMAIAIAILLVGGVVVWRLLKRAELVANPTGHKSATTRAYHNPVFGHDKPAEPRPRPSISQPSDFRHVATGSSDGYLSNPTDFRHIASGTSGLISGPSDFRHIAHGSVKPDGTPYTTAVARGTPSEGGFKLVKRVEAKLRSEPTYHGANQFPEAAAAGSLTGSPSRPPTTPNE